MLSRIADSLFWLNRYLERTDALLRSVHVNYALSLDKGEYNHLHWHHLAAIFSTADAARRSTLEQQPISLVQHLIYDTTNHNAMRAMVIRARENARGAQDHITKEVWEQVNQVYHLINNPLLQQRIIRNDTIAVLESLTFQVIQYNGVTDSTMPRNMGWNFMTLGKFIERCMITIEMADRHFSEADYDLEKSLDVLYWRNLLLSLSGYELHLKTYRSSQHNKNVADQVLFNKQFTRSAIYCLERVGFYLHKVVLDNNSDEAMALFKQFGRIHSRVEFADMKLLETKGVRNYLHDLRADLIQFNMQFSQLFFSYS